MRPGWLVHRGVSDARAIEWRTQSQAVTGKFNEGRLL